MSKQFLGFVLEGPKYFFLVGKLQSLRQFQLYNRTCSELISPKTSNIVVFGGEVPISSQVPAYFRLISALFQIYFRLISPKHPKLYFFGGKLQFHPFFQAYFRLISSLFRAYFPKTSKIVFSGEKGAISSIISSLFQAYFPKTSKIVFFGGKVAISSLISSLFQPYFRLISLKTSKIVFFGGKVAISSIISSLFQAYFRLISGLFPQNSQNCIFWGESCNFIPYFRFISSLFQPYFRLISVKTSKKCIFGWKLQLHLRF